MKFLKYLILVLVLLNVPAAILRYVSPTLGTISSYSIFLLLIFYYLFQERSSLNVSLIVLGFAYYLIASFSYIGETMILITDTIKYFVVVVCGYELLRTVSKRELFFLLLIGALTIVIEAVFFPSKFGRYSGLYLNPNVAGFICISGYGLIYGLRSVSLKLIGQFVFSLMGLLTFSRTFIALWVTLNIISLWISVKNVRIFFLGFGILMTMVFIDEVVGLNNPRFQQIMAIVNNEQVSTAEINEGSRTDTWAKFYEDILEKPFFGSGYGTFQGRVGKHTTGVHNNYLLLLGEAGFIPFLLFLAYIFYHLFWSIRLFSKAPNLVMQYIALSVFLMANHNFFNFFYILFCAMWLQIQINKNKESIYVNKTVAI
ncbi:O-antigen ligase family protein [Muricauda sp. SCSIO 64092]|uniref:O-antigen ligase family protein n=1 Tax=Allomuricauda sp. SCSIO 64092 TaxID=2908842 RepID=UPI001FF5B60C|nr:O-antigen ligase family protein [Muricauda sp. SCSIO 64092]UOY06091.1 O-antigen ligase family protein [Muricauda sp. SCSIO 64092]